MNVITEWRFGILFAEEKKNKNKNKRKKKKRKRQKVMPDGGEQ